MLHDLPLLVLLDDQVDTSQYLVTDELVSLHLDSSNLESTWESEPLLHDTLSMLLEHDHLMDYNFQHEQRVTTSSLLMPQEMLVGQVMHQQRPMSTQPESLVLQEVEDTSPSS